MHRADALRRGRALCAGYARVAAVIGAFGSAFTAPERALGLYLAAFICDELVRAAAAAPPLSGARCRAGLRLLAPRASHRTCALWRSRYTPRE
jgi:hypothetical protein